MADSEAGSKKMLAGILGIVLGWTGAHRFVLGDTTGGIIRLVISVFTCGAGGIIGLIEGIMYLTKSDAEFQRIYIEDKKAWF
ncbi:MAG TPA: TM2 domain-containing protein [Gemmataceae bacterium]|nr:TM2 domain-containing protein [Gemmataceae bacterium]